MSVADSHVRRNLVVVRAGRNSLHPRWLNRDSDRNWDLVVSLYDPDARFQHPDDVLVVTRPGGKWDGLHALLSQSDHLSRYDYVWLPDDDIEASSADIDAIFDAMRQYDLEVAQPSLTRDSYFSHFAVMSCPAFALRYANFIEIMVPCLKASLLRMVLEDFKDSMSGFGMDYIWCRLSADNRYKAAIIDRVAVRHTRPIGKALRGRMAKSGVVAEDEEQILRARYDVRGRIRPLIYAAVDSSGRLRGGLREAGFRHGFGLLEGLFAVHFAGERELEDRAIGSAADDAQAGLVATATMQSAMTQPIASARRRSLNWDVSQ